jgi:hypothetical protein
MLQQASDEPGGFRVSTHLAFVSKYLSLRSAKRLSASFCARVVPRDFPPKNKLNPQRVRGGSGDSKSKDFREFAVVLATAAEAWGQVFDSAAAAVYQIAAAAACLGERRTTRTLWRGRPWPAGKLYTSPRRSHMQW